MRRPLTIPCAGETLAATLDEATGTTGLLIVSGGNEVRAGAHRGLASLAASLSAGGVPVMRFDRRGVGDASGTNGGYASSAADIAAAAAAFRREQPLARLVGFGNCDAASALALFGRAVGIDALVLANPWVVDASDLPPAAAIRRRYRERLVDHAAWRRLVAGRIDIRRVLRGIARLALPEPQGLADRIVTAVVAWGADARIILADGDATAIAFADAAARRRLATPIDRIATASHSFADAEALLEAAIRRAL